MTQGNQRETSGYQLVVIISLMRNTCWSKILCSDSELHYIDTKYDFVHILNFAEKQISIIDASTGGCDNKSEVQTNRKRHVGGGRAEDNAEIINNY